MTRKGKKIVLEEMAKNWLPLDLLVRSKNYTFWETLEHYKKLSIVSNFVFDILWIFRTKILRRHILRSVKYQLFQNVTIIYQSKDD